MIRTTLTFAFLLSFLSLTLAQVPISNIYVFDLDVESDSVFKFTKPRYLTDFNKNGYNNQPAFFSNDELYVSVKLPHENQHDIYAFDLKKRTKLKVTATTESEFSPSRMLDYYNFSVLRQEINGQDTLQRIWQFPVDRLSNGKPVFKYMNDIGYYQWLNSSRIALFKVGRPNELVIADTYTDKSESITTNIGRCLKSKSNGTLIYVQKSEFDEWKIMEYNVYKEQITPIVETVPGSEDFALLNDGTYLMAKGSKIFKFNPYKGDEEWLEIANLRFYDINNITRLAVSGDNKIAIVAD